MSDESLPPLRRADPEASFHRSDRAGPTNSSRLCASAQRSGASMGSDCGGLSSRSGSLNKLFVSSRRHTRDLASLSRPT